MGYIFALEKCPLQNKRMTFTTLREHLADAATKYWFEQIWNLKREYIHLWITIAQDTSWKVFPLDSWHLIIFIKLLCSFRLGTLFMENSLKLNKIFTSIRNKTPNIYIYIYFIRNDKIVFIDKESKRRMRDPPHKIQESDQNVIKTLPLYKEIYTKN